MAFSAKNFSTAVLIGKRILPVCLANMQINNQQVTI